MGEAGASDPLGALDEVSLVEVRGAEGGEEEEKEEEEEEEEEEEAARKKRERTAFAKSYYLKHLGKYLRSKTRRAHTLSDPELEIDITVKEGGQGTVNTPSLPPLPKFNRRKIEIMQISNSVAEEGKKSDGARCLAPLPPPPSTPSPPPSSSSSHYLCNPAFAQGKKQQQQQRQKKMS